MLLTELPPLFCASHRPRQGGLRPEIIVYHTNEGAEGPMSAENLAAWCARAGQSVGYHLYVDQNSALQGSPWMHRNNGAGGVWDRAINIVITGRAGQSMQEWRDPGSMAAGLIAADLTRQLCDLFGIPKVRINDPRPGNKGVCGHADVSRFYPQSQGHWDPGPHFPWVELMLAIRGERFRRRKKMGQFVFSQATGDTWFITDGLTRRPVVLKDEVNFLVGIGAVEPERDGAGNIRPKWLSDEVMLAIPLVDG